MEEDKHQIYNFRKSDNYFFKANLIFVLVMVVYVVIICVSAIVLITSNNVAGGIISFVTGAVTIAIAFVFFKLFMSMLADLKYIRNKLYNIETENDKISDTFDSTNKTADL